MDKCRYGSTCTLNIYDYFKTPSKCSTELAKADLVSMEVYRENITIAATNKVGSKLKTPEKVLAKSDSSSLDEDEESSSSKEKGRPYGASPEN